MYLDGLYGRHDDDDDDDWWMMMVMRMMMTMMIWEWIHPLLHNMAAGELPFFFIEEENEEKITTLGCPPLFFLNYFLFWFDCSKYFNIGSEFLDVTGSFF